MSDITPGSNHSHELARRGVRESTNRFRRVVQTAALVLFLYLLLGTRQEIKTVLPHDLFFLVDPLASLSAMLAGHKWIVPMVVGGVVAIIAGLFFGRAWCGWLCPMGTVLDWTPVRNSGAPDSSRTRLWRHGKNFTLFVIVLTAALGSLTLVVLDPVTMLFRSLAGAVLPLLNIVLLNIDGWLYGIGPLQSGIAWFDTNVRIHLLGESGFYLPNLTILAFFVGVFALNAVRPRAWCRYLCPLGGLIGLISKLSFFRHRVDAGKCISCARCAAICPTAAIDPRQDFRADVSECITCLDCSGVCPTRAISFPGQLGTVREFQPERRRFVGVAGLAALGALMLRFTPSPNRKVPRLIRPPGASEESLTEKCIRCGECVKVCPTGAIQPADSAGAWDSTWTPRLDLRHGYCDYACNACGQVCPTGAIDALELDRKRKEIIGVAVIDKERCIPFKDKKECIVCEEMCPLSPKAVTLKVEDGSVAKPVVDAELCNGCGICEHQCPVKGTAAIKIYRSLSVAPPPDPADSTNPDS